MAMWSDCIAVVIERSFFFNDTATTEIYTLSLHDALPIFRRERSRRRHRHALGGSGACARRPVHRRPSALEQWRRSRSEEHTSELQSRQYLVCRLLLEKKKKSSRIRLRRADTTRKRTPLHS